MSETTIWFGKYGPKDGQPGKELRDIPSGYLRWLVNKMDPVPLPEYRFHDDGKPMTIEEVKALEDRYRNIIDAASDELVERGDTHD